MSTDARLSPHAPDFERPTSIRWRIVLLLMALSFMTWFNRISMPVAADMRIMKQFDISPTQMGMVYTSFFIVYAVMMIPGGWFTDRKGPTKSLFYMGIGTACLVAATGVLGMFPLTGSINLLGASIGTFYLLLLLVRSVMGFFAVPMYPASGRMVGAWIPVSGRAWANSLVTAAALVGIAITFVLFGALIDSIGWPPAFVVAGAATGVLAFAWIAYVRDEPGQHSSVNAAERALISPAGAVTSEPDSSPVTWNDLLRHRSLLLLTLSYAAVGYFQYLFFFWTHYYFEEILQLGEQKSRYYATIVNLSMAAGMAGGGFLSDRLQRSVGLRLGRSLVPIGGMLAAAGFLALGLQTLDPERIVLWFALALGALGMSEGPFWATAIELGGARGATAAGLVNTGGNIGGLIAPVMTPWVESIMPRSWDQSDRWRVAIGIGGVVAFLGAGLWCWIDPRDTLGKSERGVKNGE
jgi:ACS family D-galactonate transporter-like MFS transporter